MKASTPSRAFDLFERLEHEGETFVDELIDTRKAEEYFLDFKRSADSGEGSKLHQDDRKNLAKALSGFANSEGGVVIWGVDCSRDPKLGDVAKMKVPIKAPTRFASLLEAAVSGCTVPSVQGCRSIPIGGNPGLVATLIPRSTHAPHQLVGEGKYLIRAGSNFEPAPHGVLAGMFGRAPQPVVFANFAAHPLVRLEDDHLQADVDIKLVNDGSVV